MPDYAAIRQFLRLERVRQGFLRFIAIVLLLMALQYWARLIGVFDGPEYRFDTMSEHWRVAASLLAVGLPIAALGLWTNSYWGIVLWVLAVIVEFVMHVWLQGLFGPAPLRLAFHLICLIIFFASQAAIRFLENRT